VTAAELALENGIAGVAKLIAEHKADANIRNNAWSTTVDQTQHGTVVKWLLERGVDINSHNSSNRTPLVTSGGGPGGHRCTRHRDSDTSKSRGVVHEFEVDQGSERLAWLGERSKSL
jgi:hypothetical protein